MGAQKRLSGIKVHTRDCAVAADRLSGLTYKELSKKYDIKTSNLSRILSKDEIKEVLDAGINHMVSLTPLAVNVHLEAMKDEDNKALKLKAAETILKTTSIMPGNVQNQTINNIVNIQNNQTLSPSVSNAIGSMFKNEDEDLIEAEVIDG